MDLDDVLELAAQCRGRLVDISSLREAWFRFDDEGHAHKFFAATTGPGVTALPPAWHESVGAWYVTMSWR